MSKRDAFLTPSAAARNLGVSPKALRHYEERGLLTPGRTATGWRTYGPDDMARAREIVALRELGFSIAGIQRVLEGDSAGLDQALAAHQRKLEDRLKEIGDTVSTIATLRAGLAHGETPDIAASTTLASDSSTPPAISFDLPWPWGGERFELPALPPITYIVGPLGSGKTRLAERLAEEIPGAVFVDLDRRSPGPGASVGEHVSSTLNWLVEDGATDGDALRALISAIEDDGPGAHVVDLLEHGLDALTQAALVAFLRRRGPTARPILVLTRSNVILDLDAVGPTEQILLCPANHAPPSLVAPYPGTPGYEAVSTCLATPEVRARTEGVIAIKR